jgi:hypothetical protein
MAEEKNILEEAIIQMKNLEEAVAENAKGILDSVMRKEIKELVKESLNEQDDEEEVDSDDTDFENSDVADVEFPEDEEDEDMDDEDMDDEDMDDEDIEDEDYSDEDEMDDSDFEDEDEVTIDLRNEPMKNVLKVFSKMKDTDTISVEEDEEGNIHLFDDETDKEYYIVREGMEYDEEYSPMDETLYEIEMDMESDVEEVSELPMMEMDDTIYEIEVDSLDEMDSFDEMYHSDEVEEMYDLDEMDSFDEMYDLDEMDSFDEMYDLDEMDNSDIESIMEAVKEKTFKAPGVKTGKPKFTYPKNPNSDGFDVDMKEAPKKKYTGSVKKANIYGKSPSFEGKYKEVKQTKKKGEHSEGMKKHETKEASRTYGNGSKSGRGLRKGITPNRNLTFESVDSQEVNLLREKNEEYRKALNVFRNKLNEVAVFNSNLAYATRLFTEHSTSKQEKINILKRFDSVDTLKESKGLYKTIKDELSNTKTQQVNESVERTIQKTPSTGSAINLIESKTYENPQFMRMKDLMSKLK